MLPEGAEKAERKVTKMIGFLIRSNRNEEKGEWSSVQLVSPLQIRVSKIEEIFDLFDVSYGRFEICSYQEADVQFALLHADGYRLDWVFCRELLPWE